ncbi:MAG: hypothetical protein AMJ81_01630 [Phycisphaerae bacterium SM23_33]|nr:MAG: hypothetical protein AMJ81_01630 [Phycisphaerae bacterium SM23_33]
MDAEKRNMADLKGRLTAQLKRDKKKTAVLLVLLVVGGIVGIRAVLKRGAPGAAAAAVVSQAAPGPASSQQDDGMDGLASRLGMSARNSDATRQQYLANLDRTIARDLFRPNLAYFPPRPGKTVGGVAAPAESGWFGAVRERVLERQRAQSEHVARVRDVCLEAQKLSLTSIMLGGMPAAVINGRVVRKGEIIGGFRLESIGSSKCTLSKDGVLVDLMMER